MNKLYNELPKDERDEQEGTYLVGDALANQFFNGNWSASVELMTENYYSCRDLIEFIEEDGDAWNGFFDNSFFAELGNSTVKLN